MSKTDTLTSQVTQSATSIGAYTRVIDLFLKATREGLPVGDKKEVEILHDAWEGLKREVRFLRFIREDAEKALEVLADRS